MRTVFFKRPAFSDAALPVLVKTSVIYQGIISILLQDCLAIATARLSLMVGKSYRNHPCMNQQLCYLLKPVRMMCGRSFVDGHFRRLISALATSQ
jgi:hypothetical protein